MTDATLLNVALNADSDGASGYTVVSVFPTSKLTLPGGTITGIRVTFEGATSESFTITEAYIGHKAGSGDAYDFASTPVQMTWSASNSVTISAGVQLASDYAAFEYNQTSSLIIAIYCNGGASSDANRYKATGDTAYGYYLYLGNEAGTVNKSAGYSDSSGDLIITKIEVQYTTSAGNTGAFFALL